MTELKEKKVESYLGERFEFKYLLSPIQAKKIESYFRKIGLTLDEYNRENGPYHVNSLYFDTPTMEDYRDKDGSLNIRKKMRARTYDKFWSKNPQRIWLEIKKKRNMNVKKVRVEITNEMWADLISKQSVKFDTKFSKREQEDLSEFMYIFKRHLYRPKVIITYDRIAYLSHFLSPIRITFDNNVRVCKSELSDIHAESMKIPVTKNQVIMEVKFNGKLPWWFKRAVSMFDIERTDFSKYRNSVAVLRGINRIQIDK